MEVLERKLVRTYKAGYQIWDELVVYGDPEENTVIRTAYTVSGGYIGVPKDAHFLCKKKGIAPEPRTGKDICTVGFCEKEQKWYGWSHRAIFGFGVGAVVKEGDCTATSGFTDEWLADHPEDDTSLPVGFTARNLMDAKRMAIAFSDSVS